MGVCILHGGMVQIADLHWPAPKEFLCGDCLGRPKPQPYLHLIDFFLVVKGINLLPIASSHPKPGIQPISFQRIRHFSGLPRAPTVLHLEVSFAKQGSGCELGELFASPN